MQKDRPVSPNSTFCKGCSGRAEMKVMCPMIDMPIAGYTCVALFHCKRCIHHEGIDFDSCRVDCGYKATGK